MNDRRHIEVHQDNFQSIFSLSLSRSVFIDVSFNDRFANFASNLID